MFTLITFTDDSFAIEKLYCSRKEAEKRFEERCAQAPRPLAVFLYAIDGIVHSKTEVSKS